MKGYRCDAIVAQIIVTKYDDMGRPVEEMTSQPVKLFRALNRDFWNEVDKTVKALVEQKASAGQPPALVTKVKKKGR